jgi:hypothetical protein
VDSEDEDTIDRVAFALEYPPVETKPPDKQERHTFTITGTKPVRRFDCSDGEGGGAHVVTGYIDTDAACLYAAKIYDGVDYSRAGMGSHH